MIPMPSSDRLFYRRLTQDDLPWLIEMRSPEPVHRYLGGARLQSAEALTDRMGFYLGCFEKYGFGMSVMGLKATGELIGTSGLQPLEDTGEIEVGYNLSERFWRQGYGYEAAMAWLRFGFEQKGLERVVAIAHPENVGSWKIMEKCGMSYQGNEAHYGIDCVLYSISRDEFFARHGGRPS